MKLSFIWNSTWIRVYQCTKIIENGQDSLRIEARCFLLDYLFWPEKMGWTQSFQGNSSKNVSSTTLRRTDFPRSLTWTSTQLIEKDLLSQKIPKKYRKLKYFYFGSFFVNGNFQKKSNKKNLENSALKNHWLFYTHKTITYCSNSK